MILLFSQSFLRKTELEMTKAFHISENIVLRLSQNENKKLNVLLCFISFLRLFLKYSKFTGLNHEIEFRGQMLFVYRS